MMCVMICAMQIRELLAFLLTTEKRVLWVVHGGISKKGEE